MCTYAGALYACVRYATVLNIANSATDKRVDADFDHLAYLIEDELDHDDKKTDREKKKEKKDKKNADRNDASGGSAEKDQSKRSDTNDRNASRKGDAARGDGHHSHGVSRENENVAGGTRAGGVWWHTALMVPFVDEAGRVTGCVCVYICVYVVCVCVYVYVCM